MSARLLRWLGVGTFLLTVFAPGCGGKQGQSQSAPNMPANPAPNPAEVKTRECNSLVNLINQTMDGIQRLGDPGPYPSSEYYNATAASFDQAMNGISSLWWMTLLPLQQYAGQYKEMAGRAAMACRSAAQTNATGDNAAKEAAKAAVLQNLDNEETILNSIQAYCQAP